MKKKQFTNILSVYPYKRELKSYGFFPPIGLEHISSVAKRYADQITIIDRRFETEISRDTLNKADLILISINWWHEKNEIKEWIKKLPYTTTTIIGGRYATANAEEYLKECPNIDIVVRGDGEEILQEIFEGKNYTDIDGISYKKNASITHNRTRELSSVSDDIFPDRKLRRYKYNILIEGMDSGLEIDSVSASRGCPFSCKYCDFDANPLGQKRMWSARSPESVVNEIEDIKAEYIIFTDDIFTFDQERVNKICSLLLDRGIKKRYVINTRLNIASNQILLKNMYIAGFRVLLIGIESAIDSTLKSMQKGFTTKKAHEWSIMLKQFNFFFHGYFIIGNIDEDESDMKKVPAFAKKIGVDTLGLSLLRARKFSPLLDLLEKRPEYKIDEDFKVYTDKLTTDELRRIRREITREFYLNTFQIFKIIKKLALLGVLNPKTIMKLIYQTSKKLTLNRR